MKLMFLTYRLRASKRNCIKLKGLWDSFPSFHLLCHILLQSYTVAPSSHPANLLLTSPFVLCLSLHSSALVSLACFTLLKSTHSSMYLSSIQIRSSSCLDFLRLHSLFSSPIPFLHPSLYPSSSPILSDRWSPRRWAHQTGKALSSITPPSPSLSTLLLLFHLLFHCWQHDSAFSGQGLM